MKGKFRFLGTGGSLGIPVIGCTCPVCQSSSPLNHRTRPSGLIEFDGKRFIIDVGPDFHDHAIKYGIDHLTGVFLTHTHYDHIAGLDELRVYFFHHKKSVPCLLSKATLDELKIRYHYFIGPFEDKTHSAHCDFRLLKGESGEMFFEGLKVQYMHYIQAQMLVTGLRFKNFAYITDIKEYSKEVVENLRGVETLVLSALRWNPSPAHFNIDKAIEFAKEVGAKQTYFTHIAHDCEHEETNAKLPDCIQLAHDGLQLDIEVEVE